MQLSGVLILFQNNLKTQMLYPNIIFYLVTFFSQHVKDACVTFSERVNS